MCSVQAREKLLVFSDDTAKPYTWKKEKKLVGPIVDLITMIFKDFNIPVETVLLPWKRAIHQIEEGQIDVILTMFYTPEREKFMVYTAPYSNIINSVFVKKGKEFPFKKWEDLIGREGLFTKGDSFGAEFDNFAKKKLTIDYILTLQQRVKMLFFERGDYMINVKKPTLIEIAKMGYKDKIVPLDVPVSQQNVYIIFSKKSKFLKYLPKVNQRITEMRENGTIEKMLEEVITNTGI